MVGSQVRKCPYCAPDCAACKNVEDIEKHIEWHGQIQTGLPMPKESNE